MANVAINGFIEKYRVVTDDGPITEQNSDFNIAQFEEDYYSLSNEDRFFVLSYLKDNKKEQLLKIITKYSPGNSPLCGEIARFKNDIISRFVNQADKWEIRTAITEEIILLGFMLAREQELFVQFGYTVGIETSRNLIYQNLSDLYQLIGPIYWDTDKDGLSCIKNPKLHDICFDDKDAAPLDPAKIFDTDGDFVPNGEDPAPKNPKIWLRNNINKGTIFKGKGCDIARTDDHYRITVKIFLKPCSEANNTVIQKTSDQEYLSFMAGATNLYYENHRETSAGDVDLNIEFVDKEEDAHQVVTLVDDNKRSNAVNWRVHDLSSPAVILHETLHLLGLQDLYHEAMVHDGARDHTLAPGFVWLDPDNIMNGPPANPVIRASQMREVLQMQLNYPAEARRPQLGRMVISEALARELASERETIVAGAETAFYSRDGAKMKSAAASLKPLADKDAEAASLLVDILIELKEYGDAKNVAGLSVLRFPEGAARFYIELAVCNFSTGDVEEGIECFRKSGSSQHYVLEVIGKLLLKKGDYESLYSLAIEAQKKPELTPSSEMYLAIYHLIKGDRQSAAKYICKFHSDFFGCKIIRYFLGKGQKDIAEFVFNETQKNPNKFSRVSDEDFAACLYIGKYYRDAVQYYEKSQSIDLHNAYYIDALRETKNYDKIFHLYFKEIADSPYSIDLRIALIAEYKTALKYKEAANQILDTAAIMSSITNRHRIEDESADIKRLRPFTKVPGIRRALKAIRKGQIEIHNKYYVELINQLLRL